jgi:PAS domain S-box-containing protein
VGIIWLSFLAACGVLTAATAWLIDASRQRAEHRAQESLRAAAGLARGEWPGNSGESPARAAHDRARLAQNLKNLTGVDIFATDDVGTPIPPHPEVASELLRRQVAALADQEGFARLARHAGHQDYLFAVVRLSGEDPQPDGRPRARFLIAGGSADALLAGHVAQRRQTLIAASGVAAFLLLLTVLLDAYVRNKLRFQAVLLARERQLAAREALLVEAQRLARIGSWEIGLGPETFVASQGYYEIYGVTPETVPRTNEEYVRRFLFETADLEDAQRNRALSAEGRPIQGIRHVRLDDGTLKWLEFRVQPVFDAKGRQSGARGIVHDITVERDALEALAARSAQLEQAKEIAGMGTWTMDVADERLTTCAQMLAIYETDASNHPRTMREWARRFLPPEDQDEFWSQLDARFHGRPFDRERRIITAKGRTRWIRTIAKPQFDPTGAVVRYQGITLDITSAKSAMLELERRSKQLEHAQQLGRMGSWYWDVRTDTVEFSAQHRAIYELADDPSGITMRGWIERHCHPDEVAAALSRMEAARHGERLDDIRRVRTQSGRDLWIHVIAEPVRDASGRLAGVSGVTRDITEERIRENELLEVTRRLTEAQRIARLGHFYWDLETDRIQAFGEYDAVFGIDEQHRFQTMGEWYAKFCHPDDRAASDANLAGNINLGNSYRVERRTLMRDGSYRWLEISGEAVRGGDGRIVGYRGVARDIDDEKTLQLRLAEREARYRLITDNMHEHVALHTESGAILWSSPSSRSLLGYSDTRSVGMHPFVNVHPDDLPRVRAAIEAYRDSGDAPVTLEYRFRHRNGHFVWLETIIVPVRDNHGRLLHFQSSSRDISVRREALERLRESEERFRALTEVSSDWYWETDEQHRLTFLSSDDHLAHGASPSGAIGRTRWEFNPDGLSEEDWRKHRAMLERRETFTGLCIRVRGPDGSPGYASISGRPRFTADGRFAGYRGTGRDVTRVKLAEQQLAESEQQFRLLAHNMLDIVSLHRTNGSVLYLSPSFAQVTGHPPAAVAVSPRNVLHRADLAVALRAFGRVARGEGQATVSCRMRHADGTDLWFESHLTRFEADGQAARVQIVSRNITRRRAAEQALERRTSELARTNRQLAIEVRQRQELERNVLMTIEMELSRVGLELHDQLGQDLTGISLMAKTLQGRLAQSQPAEAGAALKISELVNDAIRHTRMISHGLSPFIWGRDGLIAALAQLAADINALGVVEVVTRLDRTVDIRDELVARNLYRIAQESANNALKHSRAQRLAISLVARRAGVELKIADDGIGSVDNREEHGGSSRFHSLRHRSSVIGAALTLRHGRGGGTIVKVLWTGAAAMTSAGTSRTEEHA